MAEVRWTPQAADDLQSIIEFAAHDSPAYARLLAIDIFEAIEQLATFPRSGRMVPEIQSPEIRELLLGNYRMIYRAKPEVVEILTIYHGARLLNPKRLQS
ncbi:MAG: type II toxin-antitoxin system RelE/ParE family toxin [Candidatus Sumerlaeia bacterium]